MAKKKSKNYLAERVAEYKALIKKCKSGKFGVGSFEDFKEQLKKYQNFQKLIKGKKMTPGNFAKLSTHDKWDVSKALKNVMWCCESCGNEQGKKLPESPFFEGDQIVCAKCDHELIRRTRGGQCNPFGFTFKKITKK